MSSNNFEIPILFLVFNRPELTLKVFNKIKEIKPKKLYIACDGPRNINNEKQIVSQVREITNHVTWDCNLKKLFRNHNLGCKNAVSGALDWFFENEDKGIILEDDCLPNKDFFLFCKQLLLKYENDPRISMITGNNFQDGNFRGDGSYYFSGYNHIWGWATWKRVWNFYDKNMNFWPEWSKSQDWKIKFPDLLERIYWKRNFDKVHANLIDTWDYQLLALLKKMGGLCITPNANLVSNIGFGENATHTTDETDKNANLPTSNLSNLKHPSSISIDWEADKYEFRHHYLGNKKKYLLFLNSFIKKLIKIFRINS